MMNDRTTILRDVDGDALPAALDRRRMLGCLAGGFGAVGLAAVLGDSAAADSSAATLSLPHHEPRAKRVIFLFMNGGPSQIDTFDPKPELARWEGKRLPVLDQNTNKLLGKPRPLGNAFPTPWKFAKFASVQGVVVKS